MSRMSEDLLGQIDFTQLAEQLGTDPDTAEAATQQALPMLLGSLASNAQQPQQRQAMAQAIEKDHDGSVLDTGNVLEAVDPRDGEAILGHIFGGRQNELVQALGTTSPGSSGLFAKLLPMLTPLVMAWLGKRMRGGASGGGGATGGGLGDILGDVLGGQVQEERKAQPDLGGLFDILGGGGGASGGGLDDLLGGLAGGQDAGSGGGLGGLLGGLLGGGAAAGGLGGLLGGLLGAGDSTDGDEERVDEVPDVKDIF